MALRTPPLFNPPPAVTALAAYPWLRTGIESGLTRQVARIQERTATFVDRPVLLGHLTEVMQTLSGGLVALEGPPGSGVTTILAHLATHYPYSFWLADDDAGQGAAALHAQLIALQRLNVPLVSPAAATDPLALERLLDEVAAQRDADMPLVLLIDPPTGAVQPRDPRPIPLPTRLPPDVLLVYGCTPDAPLPFTPDARINLANLDDELQTAQMRMLQALDCPDEWVAPLIDAAQGNFLYLRLAYALLRRDRLAVEMLKPGLDALHDTWWAELDEHDRRLVLLLAATGAPIPATVCAALLGIDPLPRLADSTGWLVEEHNQAVEPHYDLYHWVTRDYLARRQDAALRQIHAEIVSLSPLSDTESQRAVALSEPSTDYLVCQAARHAALGTPDTRTTMLPQVAQREWIRTHERRSGVLTAAARDAAWELATAAETGPLLRLARAAALAGTLESRGRTMSPDDALAAFTAALEATGRENGLKRILALVDQLPDGPDKALVLRQLGEACYGVRMRTSAMRLLSQALDLEEQKMPRAWREQRGQLLAALASAALKLGDVIAALKISGRIEHIERRGMTDTEVVRWLLDHGELEHARELAGSITHESLAAWAQAEVAVALSRAGDRAAGEALLEHITVETATAWAQIELACDDALSDESSAQNRIMRLSSQTQRDRGWTRLAHALAVADKDGDALEAAGQISDVAVRVAALLDLRLTLEGLVAMLALEQATAEIDKLTGDARVPLLATLAAAHAAIGRRDLAITIANQLAEGEEQDRALSRVAVALAGRGQHAEGQKLAYELTDDDERDWTIEELTRILTQAGRWQEAHDLCQDIRAEELRARTLVELAIARARTDDPLAALPIVQGIAMPGERTRALMMMVPSLIAQGHTAAALDVALPNRQKAGTSAAGESPAEPLLPLANSSRYLAVVAMALAEHGALNQAHAITQRIRRPMDGARAYLTIAQAAAQAAPELARTTLGTALRTATLGRAEAFRLLEQAAPVLALLEGTPLLTHIAAEIDIIDTW